MANPLAQSRIGVDIGRVLMCPTCEHDGPDTSFLSGDLAAALAIPPSPLAFEVIAQLIAATSGHVWLVSKAGRRIRERTKQWLAHHQFFARVGMDPGHLHFCFKRHEKLPIARRLRLTHFIDDRVDVLQPMRGVVSNLWLFGVQEGRVPAWVTHVSDWHDIHERTLGRTGRVRCSG